MALIAYLLQIDRKKWDAFKARLDGRTVKFVFEYLVDYVTKYGLPEQPKKKKDKPDA